MFFFIAKSLKFLLEQDGGLELENATVLRRFLKKVSLRAKPGRKSHNCPFPDGVNRGISYLSEELLEVGEK